MDRPVRARSGNFFGEVVLSVSQPIGRLAVAIAVALAVLSPTAALADRVDDQRTELVHRQLALVAELDELAASDEELTEALDLLDLWLVTQEAELARTDSELADAEAELLQAVVAETNKQAEVEELEGLMATMAVNAYVAPPGADYIATLNSGAAPADAARMVVYLDVKAQRDTDVVSRLRRAREQLGRLRQRAEADEARAEAARDDAAETLEELAATHLRYAELQTEVRARLEGANLESSLVELDLRRSSERLHQEALNLRVRGVPLASVRGIRVHRSLAGQLEALLAAAEADGIRLGGGGFRTYAEQVALRRAHCGEDHYAVYEMPSNECSPPTAPPGNSMHEVGMAIDFTFNGASISTRRSPAFRWLDDNAHHFGFYNLPSEPWHWSVNGH